MNFQKSSKRPLTPPRSFSESYIAIFSEIHDRSIVYNGKNMQFTFTFHLQIDGASSRSIERHFLSLKYDDIMVAYKTFPFSCHFQLTESEIQERDALSKSIEPRLKSIFLPSHCHSCTLLPHKCLSRNPSWPPPPPRNPSLD